MTAAKLSALADYTARAWQRDARKVRDMTSAAGRFHTRERGRAIRAAIQNQDISGALDAMGSAVGVSQWHVIERAFLFMKGPERAACLRRVWCESKIRMSPVRALPLFRAAPLLRGTVPGALPREVPVYRGAWSAEWRQARRRARNGLSWTTDRAIALAFAEKPSAVGCLATATVPRDAILAYFHDKALGFYHEHECIIDPSAIERITYERITYERAIAELQTRPGDSREKGGA